MNKNNFLKKQIQDLNKHLPKKRATLASLLEQEKPRITSKDGSTHRFKKSELEYIAEILPEELHKRLRLPIIIRISPGLGRGAARISGKTERIVVKEILGKEKSGEEGEELVIYRPEVRVIRKKLPTTTQYAFMISASEGT